MMLKPLPPDPARHQHSALAPDTWHPYLSNGQEASREAKSSQYSKSDHRLDVETSHDVKFLASELFFVFSLR